MDEKYGDNSDDGSGDDRDNNVELGLKKSNLYEMNNRDDVSSWKCEAHASPKVLKFFHCSYYFYQCPGLFSLFY